MPPTLNRHRAQEVLNRIDAILAWEARHENERDTRFVELGKYLCEVRAGQYWRLENLKSFDEFLERRFPESRRKAYYLMSIHEHLPPQVRKECAKQLRIKPNTIRTPKGIFAFSVVALSRHDDAFPLADQSCVGLFFAFVAALVGRGANHPDTLRFSHLVAAPARPAFGRGLLLHFDAAVHAILQELLGRFPHAVLMLGGRRACS